MDESIRKPRAGAVRYKDTYGGDEMVIVEPGNAMYSSALMVATEYYDTKDDSWKVIDEARDA